MRDYSLFVRTAPLIFVMLWSTGFIAAKYSMANADPFVFLCLRMTITAAILLIIVWLGKARMPRSLLEYRHDMVTDVLFHCCYLGFLFWPIKDGMPSGIVAIIIGIQPILTTALATPYIGESLNLCKAAGLLVGFVGVAIVVLGKYGLDLPGYPINRLADRRHVLIDLIQLESEIKNCRCQGKSTEASQIFNIVFHL